MYVKTNINLQQLGKLASKLFTTSEEQNKFIKALTEENISAPAILWCKKKPQEPPFNTKPASSIQPDYIDRIERSDQAGKHELHSMGHYYCLDYSSVMMFSPALAISTDVTTVLDMCAAPGGKSIQATALFHPKLLVCNEYTSSRCAALISNLKRCETPSVVISREPETVGQTLNQMFDLTVVDAPCSGQSLLVKGTPAPGVFHPATVNKCVNRQRRIIANAFHTVKNDGYLLYSTCTYAPEENEGVCEWFLKKFPECESIAVAHLADYKSQLTDVNCYRFYPNPEVGAGGFCALFKIRKPETEKGELPNEWVRWTNHRDYVHLKSF